MLNNYRKELDEDLKQDLNTIISKVENFAQERDSVYLSFLRQKNLPELFEECNN